MTAQLNDAVILVNGKTLPLTWAEIAANFEAGPIRREVRNAAKHGNVMFLARQIAFTAGGKAALEAVQAVLVAEYAAAGFDSVYTGQADPGVYGKDQIAAYMDQPLN